MPTLQPPLHSGQRATLSSANQTLAVGSDNDRSIHARSSCELRAIAHSARTGESSAINSRFAARPLSGSTKYRAPVASRRIEERIEKFGANIKAEIGARIRVVSLLGLAVKACNR